MCMLHFSGRLRDCRKHFGIPETRSEWGDEVNAFVLITSAFRGVPSAINRRIIALHGEDESRCEERGGCDGRSMIRFTAALNWSSKMRRISGAEEALALKGSRRRGRRRRFIRSGRLNEAHQASLSLNPFSWSVVVSDGPL